MCQNFKQLYTIIFWRILVAIPKTFRVYSPAFPKVCCIKFTGRRSLYCLFKRYSPFQFVLFGILIVCYGWTNIDNVSLFQRLSSRSLTDQQLLILMLSNCFSFSQLVAHCHIQRVSGATNGLVSSLSHFITECAEKWDQWRAANYPLKINSHARASSTPGTFAQIYWVLELFVFSHESSSTV